MVTVRPLGQKLTGQTFPLDSRQSRPNVRSLPQLGVGHPRLAGHSPGCRHHGVQGVLGEVVMFAGPGEEMLQEMLRGRYLLDWRDGGLSEVARLVSRDVSQ